MLSDSRWPGLRATYTLPTSLWMSALDEDIAIQENRGAFPALLRLHSIRAQDFFYPLRFTTNPSSTLSINHGLQSAWNHSRLKARGIWISFNSSCIDKPPSQDPRGSEVLGVQLNQSQRSSEGDPEISNRSSNVRRVWPKMSCSLTHVESGLPDVHR